MNTLEYLKKKKRIFDKIETLTGAEKKKYLKIFNNIKTHHEEQYVYPEHERAIRQEIWNG